VFIQPSAQESFFFASPFPTPGRWKQNPFSLALKLHAAHRAPGSLGHFLVWHSSQQLFFRRCPPVIELFVLSEPFAPNGKECPPQPTRQFLIRHCSQQALFFQLPFPAIPDKMRDAKLSAPVADSRYVTLEQLRNLLIGPGA
jgi:hypothetical protein